MTSMRIPRRRIQIELVPDPDWQIPDNIYRKVMSRLETIAEISRALSRIQTALAQVNMRPEWRDNQETLDELEKHLDRTASKYSDLATQLEQEVVRRQAQQAQQDVGQSTQ